LAQAQNMLAGLEHYRLLGGTVIDGSPIDDLIAEEARRIAALMQRRLN
jgi:hypothetical protein